MKTWMIFIAVPVLFALAIILLRRRWLRSPNRNAKSDAVNLIPEMVQDWPPPASDLAKLLIGNSSEYSRNAFWWSFAYFGSVVGSAVLSAMAALTLKLTFITNADARADTAAICATLAALFVTLSTAGDFKRKWQGCRSAEVGVQNLAYKLFSEGKEADTKAILEQLTILNTAYNQAIEGSDARAEPKA